MLRFLLGLALAVGTAGLAWARVLVHCGLRLVSRIGGRIGRSHLGVCRIFYSKAMNNDLKCRVGRGKFKALPETQNPDSDR